MITFNIPPYSEKSLQYIVQATKVNRKISGDGPFTEACTDWMMKRFRIQKLLLTTSCTHALEMCAMLAQIAPGDEVILPSYTFVSTANAFLLRGGVPVFVDIRPDTMNIDESLIEDAITPKTKAIAVVHYAGVACEMDTICDIAGRHHLIVVEDAAQGVMSKYKGKALGTIGDFGAYSFHETKNYSMGEGGALLIKDQQYNLKAEILREKGTDRSRFYRGEVDKYSWQSAGSSYLPSDVNAAYLFGQLEEADQINEKRLRLWHLYQTLLLTLKNKGVIELPFVPAECEHNAHMFFIKCHDENERADLIAFLKKRSIGSVFHYIPLHSSVAGLQYSRFHGEDAYTTKESKRLLRLPMHNDLTEQDVETVVGAIFDFYHIHRDFQ